jgi:hypothetical protein
MRSSTIVVIALLIAACGDASITEPARLSSGPRFDGGWTAGSGNRTAGGDRVGESATSSVTTCEERGGWTAGSGNREEQTCANVLPPAEASFTGYIGGGGRAAEADGPGAKVTSTAEVGMIGGGRSEDAVSTASAAGVLIGSGH